MSVEHLPAAEEAPTRFGIGQAVRRLEDRRFLTGGGRYVDDITLHKQAHAAVVRSPHAHARILHVHTEAAAAAPGVACVLTGADVVSDGLNGFTPAVMPEDFGQPPGHRTRRPPLVADKARFAGDAVALVVADTPAQARDAADMVEVEYEPLPAVIDASRAAAEGAPQVHEDCPQGNQAWMLTFGSAAAADDAFAAAAHRVGLHLDNQRLTANSIEPRGAVGEYDSGTGDYTLHTSTQNPHGVRHELAAVLGVPETRLRVIGPDVGGGFGMKGNPYPEDALVLWASRRCGRPVKWIATRYESLLTDTGGRDMTAAAELAFDDDGRIRGLRVSTLSALGAYVGAVGLVPSLFAMRLMPGPYDVRAVHLTSRGIFTNTSPVNPYRGAGRPEATYVIERLLDAAAAKLDLDGAEIRRRNLVRPEAIPYRTATGYVYDSGDFPRLLEACLARADWDGFPARRSESERWGRRRGRAVSYFIEEAGVFNDRMELRFDPTGGVTIVAGTFSHGQGHVTTFTQMVHEWLGVPVESIRFLQGDTDQVPFGRGTYASRSSMIGGNALRRAADAVIERARPMAAELLEAAVEDLEFERGAFRVVGTGRSLPMTEVARAFYQPAGITDRFGVGLEASGTWSTTPGNFPNGCHVCEVEVDVETGEVVVDRYTTLDDVGRVINPLICEGQVQGGLAQGLGQALLEHATYDPDSGQLLTANLGDYGMPRADFMPRYVTSELEEIPSTTNPLGIKGIGEASTVGAPPTVVNAVLDALRALGVDEIQMPVTPARVWAVLAAGARS